MRADKAEALRASEELRRAEQTTEEADDTVPDERLRLLFTCCHPALSPEARVALTLRTLGGLSTEAVARAFLLPVATLAKRLERAGVFRSMLRLAPTETATSLRRNGDEVLVTDGPFAETKEILGGLALIECADLDEALAFAKRCPLARIGTVEVRPEFGPPR